MTLLGARVVRVDRPARTLVCIALGIHAPNVLLVSTEKNASGVGLVARRPRGMPIDSFGLLLRKRIVGARIASLEADGGGSRVVFEVDDGLVVLESRHDRDARGFAFVDATGAIKAATYAHAKSSESRDPIDESDILEAGSALASRLTVVASEARERALRDSLRAAIDKATRKIAAIESDATRADRAPLLRREADLLVAHATDDRPGRETISVLDFHVDPPVPTTIALDPKEGARTAANRRYQAARKLERGATIAHERARQARDLRDRLLEARARLDGLARDPRPERDEALDAVESLLESIGRAPSAAPDAKKRGPEIRRPFRTYTSDRGLALWVGKSAADNDALTVGLAKPHHLFVHVRGQPGSHVIVALDRGHVCDEQSLVDAATLAAHFSSARGESPVEIVYAERRHVRKPKGSAPGSVRVDREKTMLLRFEPSRLAKLLSTER